MRASLLHGEFEAQARRSPDRIALWYQGASIRYAELDAAANRVAERLRSSGVPAGSFVGLHLDRSIEYVAALLGILKANCAVVPLPPSYPEARRRDILAFADLAAVIPDEIAPRSSPVRKTLDLAFVLCSSGSTGKPKLIVRSHASFFHRLTWTWTQHPYQGDDVCVQKSFMTTTHAIYELFEPLCRGIPVHIISDQEVRDVEGFWDTIRRLGVTRLLIAPSLLQASLDLPGFMAPPLRQMVLMGEHVPPRLAGQAIAAFPEPARIFSIYGSTEASSTLVCDVRSSYHEGQELPLGEPIAPDVQALLLNDALEPVAAGETGMLYIGGPALYQGYLKDADLTASTFISRDGQKLYRTSDRVRRLAGGHLQFVERADDTVKVRGFRVDLREVERTAALHAEVRQAAALVHSSSLILFVTPATAGPASVSQWIGERLPGYMVPAIVVPLDTFPLTPSGKIDRAHLLREHRWKAPAVEGSRFASDTERRVAEVWREVFGHGSFSRHDSFFEIGGTSLLVFAVVHRLRSMFSLTRSQLSDQAVYQHPALRALASFIEAPTPEPTDTILVTLRPGGPELPPVFLISSAGGTLGAYAKLVRALATRREIIGVRDPFNWDDRDPTLGFQAWIARYVDAIRTRQPNGPYYVVAYSSAGAPGYEVARQLRASGHAVALLALVDPLALDRATRWRFGYWALQARWMRRPARMLVRLFGWLRRAMPTRDQEPSNWTLTREQFQALAKRARRNCGYIRMLSALLELNTGQPFAITPEEMASVAPDDCLRVLLETVRRVSPETDLALIEHIVVQYEMQVLAQHNYRLSRYEGSVVLFEPESPWRGIVPAQLRPYVRKLRDFGLPIGSLDQRLLEGFPHSMRTHYLSMRDDVFVKALAERLDHELTSH